MRIALNLEYDGTTYHGWQSQNSPQLDTLQTRIEQALSQIANHPVAIICAGRTDKGVHALSQWIHFDTSAKREISAWVFGTNSCLPPDIRILQAKLVPDTFHARYSAIARRYVYIIYNHPIRPALMRHRASWCPFPLDEKKMNEGAQYLLGEHDFNAFRAADCQAKTTLRNVTHLTLQREGDFISIDIQANAFLHHMVRNIVGVLLEIGRGRRAPHWANEVLLSRTRRLGAATATPQGLHLVKVIYSDDYHL